jgi:VWFA-related protein
VSNCKRAGIFVVLGAALALQVSGHAQEPASGRPFQTEVNYVRVDMFANAGDVPVSDLEPGDVELLEDGVPQKIDSFERVSIVGQRSQSIRREPSTLDEMRRAATEARARVVVVFLDPRHVDLQGSLKIRQPLAAALNDLIGGDDLIAVMTPAMEARGLTFSRRTSTIEQMLADHWGEKDWAGIQDVIEAKYEACYDRPGDSSISKQMILRRRESQTLDALEDLSQYLGMLREERKAVITISEGWPLYLPDRTLTRPVDGATAVRHVTVDPQTGKLTSNPSPFGIDFEKCEADRSTLANLDNNQRFIRIMQSANRANVSFYPIDPRGFSSPVESATGRNRSLQMMADITDGLAIVKSTDMENGLRRIVSDLSSYYLLGYYSTAKSDGRFHRIAVRVKRPGVQVRARSGYLAASAAEAASSKRIAAPASAAETAKTQNIARALATLAPLARERTLRVQVATTWASGGNAIVRAVAEVPRSSSSGEDWSRGLNVTADLVDGTGKGILSGGSIGPPGEFSAVVTLHPPMLTPGDYKLRVFAKSAGSLGSSEVVPLTIPAAPAGSGAVLLRSGVTTGNKDVPTADARFRRTERLIVETPASSEDAVTARVLDRNGKELTLLVKSTTRQDEAGARWRRVEVTLAPLAAGDYLVETTAGSDRALVAFRLVP